MERKTGLEPATPTLARLCSTTELLPHLLNSDIIISQFCLLSSLIFSDRTDVSLGISVTLDIVPYRLLRVNRKFSFSQDVHFAASTLAVRRKVLYTIPPYFASVFLIFGTVFRARFGRQPISRPCDRRRLRLQPKRRCEITIISISRSICRGGLAALIGVTGKPYPSCLSCHSHPIRPFQAPSPKGEGCDTRIPSSKKRRQSRHDSPEP